MVDKFGIGEIPDVLQEPTTIASDDEIPDELRDETPKVETETDVAETETGNDEDTPEEEVAEAESVLETKFGGDSDKLADAYDEAQKLIGRQGNELGELREAVARLEGFKEATGSNDSEDDEDGVEEAVSVLSGYDREELLRVFADKPGEFLESAIDAVLQARLNSRIGNVEEKVESFSKDAEFDQQLRTAEQQVDAWFGAEEGRKEQSETMNEVFEEDRDFWLDYGLASGDQEKVNATLDKLSNLASSRNGTSRKAAVNKAAGKTAPRSGQSGSTRTKKKDSATVELDAILAAAKQKSMFG